MAKAKCSDEDFIQTFEKWGAAGTAKELDMAVNAIFKRRVRLEKKYQRQITGPGVETRQNIQHPQRAEFALKNGVVIVFGDAHYWPGYVSTAHRALLHFCKKLKPKIVVGNGDMVDAASISRWPPMNWATVPSVAQEIEVVQERLAEIENAAKNAKFIWPLGNHDARFETRLATVAKEYANLNGFHLKDYFPAWWPCWSCWINDEIVIKHSFRGGMHAPRNNVLNGGKNIITNHLHSQKVMPVTNYAGTLYGVDTGCLADPFGPQFEYAQDNPRDWRSGFAVLTIRDGYFMAPELVTVVDENTVQFRGELINVQHHTR